MEESTQDAARRMSGKDDGRLYVLLDQKGVLWGDEEFSGITPVAIYTATRAADAANLEGNDEGYSLPLRILGLYDPATERVVPKEDTDTVDGLRKKLAEMHRRAQTAEGALPSLEKFNRDVTQNLKTGKFIYAVMASELNRAQERIEELEASAVPKGAEVWTGSELLMFANKVSKLVAAKQGAKTYPVIFGFELDDLIAQARAGSAGKEGGAA